MKRSPMKRSTKRLTPEYTVRKRQVLHRDEHCQYPDCGISANSLQCDVHHILTGGGDGMDNLVTLCNELRGNGHHQWVHLNRRKAEAMGLRKSSVRVSDG